MWGSQGSKQDATQPHDLMRGGCMDSSLTQFLEFIHRRDFGCLVVGPWFNQFKQSVVWEGSNCAKPA